MKYIWKNPRIFSLWQVHVFGRKLHCGGPLCFSKQCNLVQVWWLISSHRPPSTSYWQRSPSQGAALWSSCKSRNRDLSVKLVFQSGTLAETHKDFCQNCDCSLKEHPLFSLKSTSHQPSCYLSSVNSTALMVNFTSRKRLHFVKRKFWTLTSLIFKWLVFTNLHHPNLFHSSGLCFSKQNQVVSL